MADSLGVVGWWATVGGSEVVHSSTGRSERVRSGDSPHEIEACRSKICGQ